MELFVGKTAAKQLLKIPHKIRVRIENDIEQLANNPYLSHSKKLSNRDGWRLRTGDYRTLYAIDKKRKIIMVLSVQHRKDVYRKI